MMQRVVTNSSSTSWPQLSQSSSDKLNQLVQFTTDLRQATAHPEDRIQRGSPRARFLASLMTRKCRDFQQLSINQIFQDDSDFPGMNILQAHFAIFQGTLETPFNDGGNEPGYTERVFYLERLMYDSGLMRGHAEVILEQNSYWRSKIAGTQHQPLARQLNFGNTEPRNNQNPSPTPLSRQLPSQPNSSRNPSQPLLSRQLPSQPNSSRNSSQPPLNRQLQSQSPQQVVRASAIPPSFLGTASQGHSSTEVFAPPTMSYASSSNDSLLRPPAVPTVSPALPSSSAQLTSPSVSPDLATIQADIQDPHLVSEEPVTVKVDLLSYVHSKIVSLWKEEKHTDVTFVVGEGKKHVLAHRAILACQSDYFESLLFGDMVEAGKEMIALEDVTDPDRFILVVNYAYTGQLEIENGKLQDVLDVLAMADRFGFVQLKEALSEKLASVVTLKNVLHLLLYADLYQASSLLNQCLTTVDQKAEEVLSSEAFLALAHSTLSLIISRDTFFVPEMMIYNSLICWKDFNGVSKEELEEVLGSVRLSEIPPRDLFVTVEPAQLFKPTEITSALRVQIKPEFQQMKPRGRKASGKNVLECGKFVGNGGNVTYGGSRIKISGPPSILDGVVTLDAPRKITVSKVSHLCSSNSPSGAIQPARFQLGGDLRPGAGLVGGSPQPAGLGVSSQQPAGLGVSPQQPPQQPAGLGVSSQQPTGLTLGGGLRRLGSGLGVSPQQPAGLGGFGVSTQQPAGAGLTLGGGLRQSAGLGSGLGGGSQQPAGLGSGLGGQPAGLGRGLFGGSQQPAGLGGGSQQPAGLGGPGQRGGTLPIFNSAIYSGFMLGRNKVVNSQRTISVELNDVYLLNTISFRPFSYSPGSTQVSGTRSTSVSDLLPSTNMNQWCFSYKIRISKTKDNWETLFDFSEMDCYFDQILQFPTQAVKYIEFELTSCTQQLQLKFVSCSFEDMKPFNFKENGVIAPHYPCSLMGYQVAELPPGMARDSDLVAARTAVINTPHSMSQLSFKILGPDDSLNGDIAVLVSAIWESESFKEVRSLSSKEFGTELCVKFDERVVSYVLVLIKNIQKKDHEPMAATAESFVFIPTAATSTGKTNSSQVKDSPQYLKTVLPATTESQVGGDLITDKEGSSSYRIVDLKCQVSPPNSV